MITKENPFYKLIYEQDKILKIFLYEAIDNTNYILGLNYKKYYIEKFNELSKNEKNIVHHKLKSVYLSNRLISGI